MKKPACLESGGGSVDALDNIPGLWATDGGKNTAREKILQ
jgi:hypothetical protein